MTAVLVTRPGGENDPLVAELESRGFRVRVVPTVLTRALPVEWPDFTRYDWVVVTSAAGVAALPVALTGPRWAAVGEATASALRARGVKVDLVPADANGIALAEALPGPGGTRVLLVRASLADPDLPAGLRKRGALVDEVTAYETVEGPAESAEELRETRLDSEQLIAPLFVISGRETRHEIPSLVGHHRLTPDLAVREAHRFAELGIGGVLLFGIPESKDRNGSGADDPRGPVPETLRLLRAEGLPLALAADVCLCEYTSHGHCGVLDGEKVDNDATLPRLAAAAIAYAEAGADIVGPSAMMDGQVAALRSGLDAAGLGGTAIMAYASKHASSFYGPFREAAGSTPSFGDRKSYQMDPANAHEALREMQLDADEGADILMVKPAITSLDLLAHARQRFDLPLAAYQVSGEAAMIEAAAQRGWIDRRGAILESLTAIARAGAGIVMSYFAADAAAWLRERR